MRLKYQDSDLMNSNRRKDFGRKGSHNRSSKYHKKKHKNEQKSDNLFGAWEEKMKTLHKGTPTKKSSNDEKSKSFFSKFTIIIIIFVVLVLIIIYYLMNRDDSESDPTSSPSDPTSSESDIDSYLSNNSIDTEYSIMVSDRSYLPRRTQKKVHRSRKKRRKVLNLLESTKFQNTPVSKTEILILDDT